MRKNVHHLEGFEELSVPIILRDSLGRVIISYSDELADKGVRFDFDSGRLVHTTTRLVARDGDLWEQSVNAFIVGGEC